MTLASVIAVPLAGFWSLVCWRVRVERGWVGLTDHDRQVLRVRVALLRAYEAVGAVFLPVFRRLGEAFARAKPLVDALNERMLADPEGWDG
jgi:hypothetical protein